LAKNSTKASAQTEELHKRADTAKPVHRVRDISIEDDLWERKVRAAYAIFPGKEREKGLPYGCFHVTMPSISEKANDAKLAISADSCATTCI
jgi:hypothetical protein